MQFSFKLKMDVAGSFFEPQPCNFGKLVILFEMFKKMLVPFFEIPHRDRLAKNVKSLCVQIIPRSTCYITHKKIHIRTSLSQKSVGFISCFSKSSGSMELAEPTLTTILHLNVHAADAIGLFTNLV